MRSQDSGPEPGFNVSAYPMQPVQDTQKVEPTAKRKRHFFSGW